MKNMNFKIKNGIIRIISETSLATIILAGAASAQTLIVNAETTNHDLAHYTKVAGKDTGKEMKRGFNETDKTLKHGGEDAGHAALVSARTTERFFHRVGRAVV